MNYPNACSHLLRHWYNTEKLRRAAFAYKLFGLSRFTSVWVIKIRIVSEVFKVSLSA